MSTTIPRRLVATFIASFAWVSLTGGAALAERAPREDGASIRIYQLGESISMVPELVPGQTPNFSAVVPTIKFNDSNGNFFGFEDHFLVIIDGFINIRTSGKYEFRLESDDGSILWINGKEIINNDGLHGRLAADGSIQLEPGEHPFRIDYFENTGDAHLSFWWRPPGEKEFVLVPAGVMTAQAGEVRVTSPGVKKVLSPSARGTPGDRQPLRDVHPSFTLAQARPSWFEPKVGGMDWLSDGRLVICTWDPEGAVYILDGVRGNDPESIEVYRFATGLAEPLGLAVVNDRIFVLQKQELTELIDHSGDGVADEYRVVATGWPVTSNFHEFAFGLVYKDGHFYFNLAIAIDPGGKSTEPQAPLRGSVLRVNAATGEYEVVAHGLRTPNGIGIGVDNEIFLTDNQGDWVPVSTLLHLREGAFYGSRAVIGDEAGDLPVMRPVVWLPQGEIGNSPSQPLAINVGPYRGQMIHGEVTHGGVKRVYVEKIDGEYQGCVFRFTQGLEAGINRISWGPDGALYVGGIGSTGNWGQDGKKRFGLQRLTYNGRTTFEMLAVRARSNGLEIEFTKPLARGHGWDPGEYHVEHNRYVPTVNYGGPKVDLERLEVRSASVSPDRRRVFLEIPGIEADRVIYLRLAGEILSQDDERPWSTEAWYTMNAVPRERPGSVIASPFPRNNTLTEQERADGWELLFDGKTLDGWGRFKSRESAENWRVEDGMLTRFADGGDIVTDREFGSFELVLDWRVAPRGNSGIFFRVSEAPQYHSVWQTGPEMQILDNAGHPDGRSALTSAGSNYALHAPVRDATLPVGRFNRARLVVRGNHVEHWLNGVKLLEYELKSADWHRRVARSKFAEMPSYGVYPRGVIALQDHGDHVQFRNIKIRVLDGDE